MEHKQMIKEKNYKYDSIKILNFYSSKDYIKKIKRQATDWEEISSMHISDIELASRVYKNVLQLNSSQTTQF